jgi:acyl-CoA thioester hydrolase
MSNHDITYRGMVHQWHCDHMGHMNVMWYVGKFDEATWNLAASLGMTSRYMKEAQRGMAAVDQRICYRREALVGDVLTVRSAVLEIKPRSIRFVHEMVRDQRGDLLAVMMVTGVHIDVRARKSVEFEPHILEQSRARIAPDVTRWEGWPPERAYLLDD